jgi:hypothetical protein
MVRKLLFTTLISSIVNIVSLPAVYAQFGWYAIPGPEYWLDNPWVVFTVFFAIFFATIYVSLGRVFKGNVAPAAVIAAALSFVISAGIQRDWQFLQKPIMFWALILLLILAILTFFKAIALGPIGSIGLILIICGSWPYIKDTLSVGAISSMPYGLISFLDSISIFLAVLFYIGIILFGVAFFRAIITGRWYGGKGRE